MRLLNTATLELEEFVGTQRIQPYAILSHVWEDEEVTFALLGKPEVTQWKGYQKIIDACRRASKDGYRYIWIDTCCINKDSSSELSEAINSMFSWYRQAAICYVYMYDVETPPHEGNVYDTTQIDERFGAFPGNISNSIYATELPIIDEVQRSDFAQSEWFTRGWTLQELLAPSSLTFCSRKWEKLGDRDSLSIHLAIITGISIDYLLGRMRLLEASIAERMSWASNRSTTRPEDQAYSLLGIFDVSLPLLYGEGQYKAFLRLQEEIMKRSDDHSLFAWKLPFPNSIEEHGLLAPSPFCFRESHNLVPDFDFETPSPFAMTNKGLNIRMRLEHKPEYPWPGNQNVFQALLNCTTAPHYNKCLAIYLKRVGEDLQQFRRVHCDQLIEVQPPSQQIPQTIFVIQHNYIPTRRKLWPKSMFMLRKGPGGCRVNGLVSVKHANDSADGKGIPKLAYPCSSNHAHDLEEGIAEILHQSSQDSDKWLPENVPSLFEIPRTHNLVALAIEFQLNPTGKTVIMLGTGTNFNIGYCCKHIQQGDRTELRHCGKFFHPKPILDRSTSHTLFTDDGSKQINILIQSNLHVCGKSRLIIVDLSIDVRSVVS